MGVTAQIMKQRRVYEQYFKNAKSPEDIKLAVVEAYANSIGQDLIDKWLRDISPVPIESSSSSSTSLESFSSTSSNCVSEIPISADITTVTSPVNISSHGVVSVGMKSLMYARFIREWIVALENLKNSSSSSWFEFRRLTRPQQYAVDLLNEKLCSLRESVRSEQLNKFRKIGEYLADMQKLKVPSLLSSFSPYNETLQTITIAYRKIWCETEKMQEIFKKGRQAVKDLRQKEFPPNIPKTAATLLHMSPPNARLMLPMYPAGEAGVIEGGYCAGYAFQFLQDFLQNKPKSFGIYRDKESPFRSLMPEAAPELNHLAPLTENIVRLQLLLENDYWEDNDLLKTESVYATTRVTKGATENLAKTIIKLGQRDAATGVKTGYYISLSNSEELNSTKQSMGHAITICCNATGGYDVVNANRGWIRYDSAIAFEKNFSCNYKFYDLKSCSTTPPSSLFSSVRKATRHPIPISEFPISPISEKTIPTIKYKPTKSSYCSVAGMIDADHHTMSRALKCAKSDKQFGVEKYRSIKIETLPEKRKDNISQHVKTPIDYREKENSYLRSMTLV